MASFSERVTIYIETKVDNAKSQLSALKSSVQDAEGGVGKLKAAASGMGSILSSVASSPAVLAGAGTALVGVATKAVGAFTDLGLAVGKFRDASGIGAEQSSRFVEVFEDLGIGADKGSAAIGRMSKLIGESSDVFSQYGIDIKTAADGTTDVSATFISAIETLSKMKNPTEQAAAANALFGKSWRDMAELIEGGASGLQAALDGVQSSKILDDEDVQSARDMRDAMDALRDAGEGLLLTLGKELAPAIAQIAPKIAEMVQKGEPAVKALGESFATAAESIGIVLEALGPLIDGLTALQGMKIDLGNGLDLKPLGSPIVNLKNVLTDAFGDVEIKAQTTFDGIVRSAEDVEAGARSAATGVDALTGSIGGAASAADDAASAQRDYADAIDEMMDASISAADSQLALLTAAQKFGEATAASNAAMKEHGENSAEAAEAYANERDAAIDLAKANVRLAQDQATAAGSTLSATDRIAALNASLIDSARTATPAAKAAIVSYITSVNQIPPEKATEIQALIDQGKYDEALAMLNDATQDRTATMNPEVNSAALGAAAGAIDNAARSRTVELNVRATGLDALTGAISGAIARGNQTLVRVNGGG